MAMSVNPIRIMVVDDHEVVREGLSVIIQREADMEIVAQAKNGHEAIDQYRRHQPDVVVMDLNMPVKDGVEATTAIHAEFPNCRILVLSVASGDEDIFRALQAGAKGYLLKETLGKDLLKAIRSAYQGQSCIPAEVAQQLAKRFTVTELTPRELDVLRLMTRGKSNREIANMLGLTEGTVKGYVSIILSKLNVSDRTQAVTTALQRGLVRLD